MLAEIARQTEALRASNRALEKQIAERSEAERALRDSERRNRTLVAATTSVVWTADRERHFAAAQTAWGAYTGQSQEDYGGAGWLGGVNAGDRPLLGDQWEAAGPAKTALDCGMEIWKAACAR